MVIANSIALQKQSFSQHFVSMIFMKCFYTAVTFSEGYCFILFGGVLGNVHTLLKLQKGGAKRGSFSKRWKVRMQQLQITFLNCSNSKIEKRNRSLQKLGCSYFSEKYKRF